MQGRLKFLARTIRGGFSWQGGLKFLARMIRSDFLWQGALIHQPGTTIPGIQGDSCSNK